jgi:hypothetical protein
MVGVPFRRSPKYDVRTLGKAVDGADDDDVLVTTLMKSKHKTMYSDASTAKPYVTPTTPPPPLDTTNQKPTLRVNVRGMVVWLTKKKEKMNGAVYSEEAQQARKTSRGLYFHEAGQWVDRGMDEEMLSEDNKPIALACYLRAYAIYRYGLSRHPKQHMRAVMDVDQLAQQLHARIVSMADFLRKQETMPTMPTLEVVATKSLVDVICSNV